MSLDAARGVLACPVCEQGLDVGERPVRCPEGHAFDVARQGYVNLLGQAPPANADTPAMVAARDRVLTSGLYAPIAEQVATRLWGASVVLDVGAGTGYYLAAALDAHPDARGVALDVSVAAAKRAARAHGRAASVVGDVWGRLPVRPRRVGAVLCVFAPRNMAEFARVLVPGGLLVVVTPTASHLAGLRERHGLLGIEPDKDDRLLRSASGYVEAVGRWTVEYAKPASAGVVRDLIAMGPNAFHGVPDDVAPADVDVSVHVWCFRTPLPV